MSLSTIELDQQIVKYLGKSEAILKFLHSYSPNTKRKLFDQIRQDGVEPTQLFHEFLIALNKDIIDIVIQKTLALDDMSDQDIEQIAADLGHTTLEPAINPINYPVHGIVFGVAYRTFITLTVKPANRVGPLIYVNFLYVNGSPRTHIRAETMNVLHPNAHPRTTAFLNINGLKQSICVTLCDTTCDNVDILGQDFMVAGGLLFTSNFRTMTCSIAEQT